MSTVLWNLLFFMISLGILVTIHELGHFLVARYYGVKVQRFSFGFGKPWLSWYDKHGTEFAIAPIWLGGYVKMLDARNETVPPELADQEFTNKPVGQRIAILFAGPLANFVVAVVVLWLAAMVGHKTVKPVIGEVIPQSIAEQAGVKQNSQILMVDEYQTRQWRDVNFALLRYIGADQIPIQVQDLQTQVVREHVLNIEGKNLDRPEQSIFTTLGIKPFIPTTHLQIAAVHSGSAAQQAGLQLGDQIISVNDQVLDSWAQLVSIIQDNPGRELHLQLERDQAQLLITVIPQQKQDSAGISRGFLGVTPRVDSWPAEYLVQHQYGVMDGLVEAFNQTGKLIELSFVMIGKLITADLSLDNLSGPVSIAQGAGNSAEGGLYQFLWFLALISINLGVINLLPIPMLDGGHIFYYVIELIRGKSVSQRAQEVGLMCGALVLLLLMGISIMNDISRLS